MEVKQIGFLKQFDAVDYWQDSDECKTFICPKDRSHGSMVSTRNPKINQLDVISASSHYESGVVLKCNECNEMIDVPEEVYEFYIDQQMSHNISLGQVVEFSIGDMSTGKSYRVTDRVYGDGTVCKKDEDVIGDGDDICLGHTGTVKAIVVGLFRDCDGEPLYTVSDIRVKLNGSSIVENMEYKKWASFIYDGLPEYSLKVVEKEFVALKYKSIYDYTSGMLI